jgi:(1->4)-alpha-D-glucan 1-alpha-D-glucosylmutase
MLAVLRARPGSEHGYDVVSHREINPELGGRAGFERMAAALRAHGIGIVLDIVPNHMCVTGPDNAGGSSARERARIAVRRLFRHRWAPINADLRGKVLLAVLGDHYGEVLARGELVLAFDAAAARSRCATSSTAFRSTRAPVGDPVRHRSARRLAAEFGRLPSRDGDAAARATEKERLKSSLAALVAGSPAAARAIDAALARFNAEDPARNALHELLEAQALPPRLLAGRDRRHQLPALFRRQRARSATGRSRPGVRGDAWLHLDLPRRARRRLADRPSRRTVRPRAVFRAPAQAYTQRAGAMLRPARRHRPARALYVVAEKITARHEHSARTWAVHGTTGYRFATVANGVFVDGAAQGRIDRVWRSFTGETSDFEEAAFRGKWAIMRSALASELTVLATQLLRIARADRRTRDYTFNALRNALAEATACCPSIAPTSRASHRRRTAATSNGRSPRR